MRIRNVCRYISVFLIGKARYDYFEGGSQLLLACTLDTNYITKNAMIDNTKTPLTFYETVVSLWL